MAPSAATVRNMLSMFQDSTGSTERTANKFLKSTGYNLNQAVDLYFQSTNSEPRQNPVVPKLEKLFDSLRDAQDAQNEMGLDAVMKYLSEDLSLSIENAELLVAMELVQAPSVGEITRTGFVNGWKDTGCEPNLKAQSKHVSNLAKSLSTNSDLFKNVYKHTFVCAREKDQKALSLENALTYWEVLFSPPGWEWKGAKHDWFQLWKQFLAEKWTRSVNKDMWNMTLNFATKSVEDETLSFWSEDGAWPSVIDDFVAWCKGKGVVKADEAMEVDDS